MAHAYCTLKPAERPPGNTSLTLANVRALSGEHREYLHAGAIDRNGAAKRIAVAFGPEDGTIDSQQVFFPKTSAGDNLEKSLRGRFADGVWARLAGAENEPFAAGPHRQIATKAIGEWGNELMVVKGLTT